MKIAVFGLGYVGLSNAVLLAHENEVVGVDLSADRIQMINQRISPIVDADLQRFLKEQPLNLTATSDKISDVQDEVFIRDLFDPS